MSEPPAPSLVMLPCESRSSDPAIPDVQALLQRVRTRVRVGEADRPSAVAVIGWVNVQR